MVGGPAGLAHAEPSIAADSGRRWRTYLVSAGDGCLQCLHGGVDLRCNGAVCREVCGLATTARPRCKAPTTHFPLPHGPHPPTCDTLTLDRIIMAHSSACVNSASLCTRSTALHIDRRRVGERVRPCHS